MQTECTPNSPDELLKRFSDRQAELRKASGYTVRQKQLIVSLLDSDDDELFDEVFHKKLLIELVGFMHEWHMRITAGRLRNGDFESAMLWLQDTTRLSLIQAQAEAIQTSGGSADQEA